MTLRILGSANTAPLTVACRGSDLASSAKLVSSIQSSSPDSSPIGVSAFTDLKHTSKQLLDSAAANAQNSVADLNAIKSVLDTISEQLERLHHIPLSNGADVVNAVEEIAKTLDGTVISSGDRKITSLFDPRHSNAYFEELWSNPLLCVEDTGAFVKHLPQAISLINDARARTSALIASGERILLQSAVAQENISASNSIPERGTTAMG